MLLDQRCHRSPKTFECPMLSSPLLLTPAVPHVWMCCRVAVVYWRWRAGGPGCQHITHEQRHGCRCVQLAVIAHRVPVEPWTPWLTAGMDVQQHGVLG